MKKEIGLDYLAPYLKNCHIKLNLFFLKNLIKNASRSEKPYINKAFAKKINSPINKTKKSAMTIYGWMKGYRTVPISKLIKIINLSDYSWKDIEKNLISIKSGIRSGEIKPKFPIVIDYKLGSIVGHILGDGSIEKRFHSVFYSNSNIFLLDEFRGYAKGIFGIEPRIWIHEKRAFHEKSKWLMKVNNLKEVPNDHSVGLFYPKICCDILYAICGKFAEGKNKNLTKEIKKFQFGFKIGLIRAFFDDEGSIRSDNHTMRLHQDKINILNDIKEILKKFDIESNIIRSYNKNVKTRYYFNITGFKNYYKFFKIIGCTSPNKRKEFVLLINKVKNSKYFKKKYAL